jgi:inosine-uridine nucleoside N-ribohydrolase
MATTTQTAEAGTSRPPPAERAAAALDAALSRLSSSPRPRPIWLDCDPGHDDAMAILLACHLPQHCRLVGVSTVACNQSLEKVTRNALDVLSAVGCGGGRVPVVAGAARPLVRPGLPPGCPEIHGDSGLDGPEGGPLLPHCGDAPLMDDEAQRPAVAVMHAAIARAAAAEVEAEAAAETGGDGRAPRPPGAPPSARPRAAPRVALVCTGALTNAALLLSVYPQVAGVVEVFVMGGATTGVGNTSPCAEFNIQTDPEALAVLLRAAEPAPTGGAAPGPSAPHPPLRLTLVPLEVTHTALVTPGVLRRLGCGGGGGGGGGGDGPPATPFRRMLGDLLTFFAGSYKRTFAFDHPPLHDPCAVLAAVAPSLFDARRERCEVVTACPLTAGQTVLDRWRQLGRPENVTVAHAMDVEAFWEVVAGAVERADAASPLNKQGT